MRRGIIEGMELSRRALLAALGAAGLAGAVTACDPAEPTSATAGGATPRLEPKSWDSVRTQFALNPDAAHLAMFVLASHPAAVRAAIDTHRRRLDTDPIGYLHANEGWLNTARATAAAAYLQTKPEQIAFTDSTTMGLGLLYTGLRLQPGDEVLTTEHDFHSTHESLRLRASRDGARVRRVRLYDNAATVGVDEVVSKLAAALTPRTRIVALTWVHSSTGVKLPIKAIAEAVRSRSPEALLCVDGVHGLGVEDAGPDQLGCDFLVSGTHKWLFGPRGTGLIWGSPRGWARFTPVIPSFDASGTAAAAATPGGYHSFEHRWALTEAFDFHAAIGRRRVAARTHELATGLKDGLSAITGVRLSTPKDPALSAGVVCCEVVGVEPAAAVARLAAANVVASTTPYNPSHLRFGATIANGERDVEAALKATRALT